MNALTEKLIPKIYAAGQGSRNALTEAALILAGVVSNDASDAALQSAIADVEANALSSENPAVWIAALLVDVLANGLPGGGSGGASAPIGATYVVQTADGTLTNEQALGALSTGLLKNTTTTGVLSIAVAGTDYLNGGVGTITDTMLATSVKPAVAVVAIANVTLSGEQTIDGVLTSSSLVLTPNQTTGADRGPWVSGAGAWTRPSWYTNGSTTQAPQFLTVFVRLGTTYQGSTWRMTTAGVTIGTTATTWAQTPISLASTNVTGVLPIANGGTGTSTVAAARVALKDDVYRGIADVDATLTTADRVVSWTSISTARVATLPAASSLNAGQELIIGDISGSASLTNTITITRAGADTIDGATTEVIAAAYGKRRLISDGVSKWGFDKGVARLAVANTFTALNSFPDTGLVIGSTSAVTIARLGTANLRLGTAPSATPVAQTLTLGEASRSGTDSNVAGANGILQMGGLGTGTGTVTTGIFQTATVAASGTTAQTYTTRLTLDSTGATVAGSLTVSPGSITASSGSMTCAGTGAHAWNGRASLYSSAVGVLCFEGLTSSFPAIKRSTTTLKFRLADDSADAAITAAGAVFTGAVRPLVTTVASLPAGTTGDTAVVTDALTPTYAAAVVGGGSVVCHVLKNATVWVVD